MMNKLNPTPVQNAPDSDMDNLSKRRRAFIKGSAMAVPVVLTLRNGSAFAAQSLTCLQRQAGLQPATLVFTEDNFVREPSRCRDIGDGANITTVYEFPKGSGRWYDYRSNNNDPTYYIDLQPFNARNPKMHPVNNPNRTYNVQPYSERDCWVIAHIDLATGKKNMTTDPVDGKEVPLVGPIGNAQTEVAATTSCMDSIF